MPRLEDCGVLVHLYMIREGIELENIPTHSLSFCTKASLFAFSSNGTPATSPKDNSSVTTMVLLMTFVLSVPAKNFFSQPCSLRFLSALIVGVADRDNIRGSSYDLRPQASENVSLSLSSTSGSWGLSVSVGRKTRVSSIFSCLCKYMRKSSSCRE